jgi:hypothetical protein
MRARFEGDERGSAIEKFAIAGGLLALASVFLGSTLERMAESGSLPTIALLAPDQYVATRPKTSDFDAIDYTATGSISGRVVLDPCSGRRASP